MWPHSVIKDGSCQIKILSVNHVVSPTSLLDIVTFVYNRSDRIACDDIKLRSLRWADERSNVGLRKFASPLRAVDVCLRRSRFSSRRSLNFLNAMCLV